MSPIEGLFARYGPAYRWLATGTVMIATIAVVLSTTIVNVAIPDVMGAFGISQVQAQWISTGFLAAMTVTMLLTDWADKAFGQRATMIGALSIFMIGSILGGVAPNENILTAARVIQDAAAGVVQPFAMILLSWLRGSKDLSVRLLSRPGETPICAPRNDSRRWGHYCDSRQSARA